MKKLTLALLAVCMVFSFSLTSCKKTPKVTEKTLKDLVQGKTWKLGTVTKNGTNVTSDFTGFQISFSADGGSGQIISGGTSSQTVSVSYNIATSTITISGTPPTGWAATLTSVEATPKDSEATAFKFTVNISNPKTGAADHVFNLVR